MGLEIRYGALVKGFYALMIVMAAASLGKMARGQSQGRALTQPNGRPAVSFELKSCPQLNENEVRRIFSAEVGTRLTEQAGPFVTEASASCEGTRVVLSLVDPVTRKTVRRSVDLASNSRRGRERLVAIATAELLFASWAELAMNPDPVVKPEGLAPPREMTEAARQFVARPRSIGTPSGESSSAAERPPFEETQKPISSTATPGRTAAEREQERTRNLRLSAMGGARSFLGQRGTLLGGGLRLAQERFAIVSWAVDSLMESGRIDAGADRYRVQSASFGATLAFFWRSDWITARLGAGVRAGIIRVETEGAQAESADVGIWGWPLLGASLTAFGWHTVALELNGESGYSILSPGTSANLRGVWVAGQVGIGFLL